LIESFFAMTIRWIYRDLYVAYKIPEVRWLIVRTYALRHIRNLIILPLMIACVPFLICQLIGEFGKGCVKIVIIPGRMVSQCYDRSREATYSVMSAEEMRNRLTGHVPGVVEGTLRRSVRDQDD
jgi:hypothetical protein